MKLASCLLSPFRRSTVGIVFLTATVCAVRADIVVDWNVAMTDYALPRSPAPLSPFAEARVYAMAHVAMLDAIKEASHQHGRDAASPEAAGAQAAHDVLVHEFADGASAFDALLATELAAIPNGTAKSKGIAVGVGEAAEMIFRRANDGAANSEGPYTPGSKPGDYQFTPPFDGPPFNGLAQAVNWGSVTPFSLKRGSQFRAPPPYKIGDIDYTFDFNEIKSLGSTMSLGRTDDQTALSIFWSESSSLGWNHIARILAASHSNTLLEHAQLFAELNVALTDGSIASFDSKYTYNFWRPITAIRKADTDGNNLTSGDPTWDSLLLAPPVPDYPSNHAAMGGAASVVLISFFGDEQTFSFASSLPGPSRAFQRISEAAKENAISRMLGGIHFRLACMEGYDQGVQVGTWVVKHRNFGE